MPSEASIEIEFSEKIDRDKFPEAIFISPDPGGELKFKYKGRRVRIHLPKELLPDRTYVVTVGTDLRDNHNVAMEESFTLAFSTGDSIDRGEISGRVFADKPQGISLWAYILPDSGIHADIDPRKRSGDYVTQAGVEGAYRIPFIAGGKYRVFAVNDLARDGIYDPVEDEIGVPDRDVEITPGKLQVDNLDFRMALEDTISPVLSSASLVNATTVEVRFDEPITIPDSLLINHFLLTNTKTQTAVTPNNAANFPLDPKLFYLLTNPIDSIASFVLEAKNVTDVAGNAIDSAFAKYEFGGNARPDTVQPKILRVTPEDSSNGIALDQEVRIVLSEWMQQPDSAVGMVVRIADTSRTVVQGKLRWHNPFELGFKPDTTWKSNTRYDLEIANKSLLDYAGNALFDTLATRTFATLNADTLSEISGKLETSLNLPDSTLIYLKARQVAGGKAEREIWLQAPRAYTFQQLLPGVYMIEGFFDTKPNRKYDFGKAFPFIRSERFFVYPDSIKIRSKWPNEGNDIVVEK
ncbi:MAG: Ig-like domain-containing protein [bacterium]